MPPACYRVTTPIATVALEVLEEVEPELEERDLFTGATADECDAARLPPLDADRQHRRTRRGKHLRRKPSRTQEPGLPSPE